MDLHAGQPTEMRPEPIAPVFPSRGTLRCASAPYVHRRPGLQPSCLGALLLIAVLATPALVRAQVSVPFSATISLANTSQVASYVVALGSLPLRPELVIDAVPDAAEGGIQLQIELTDFQFLDIPGQDFCPAQTDTIVSPAGSGAAQLDWKVWRCLPQIGDLVGDSVRVNVRVLSFGTTPAPATIHIGMRGVTTVPNSTMLLPYFPPGVPITVTIPATRDTTIYERNPSGSNGAGQFLWAGRDVNTSSPFTPYRVRSLVTFDLRTNYIPESATINSVELRLDVESILGTGNSLSVWSAGFDGKWDEGNADAAGSEFQSGTSSARAANWVNRGLSSNLDWDWPVPGGDPDALLATQSITTTGVKVFAGATLRDAVDQMRFDFYNLSGFQDGFVLRGPETSSTSSGVQIASRENSGAGANAPVLLVNLTQDAGEQIDIGQSGVVTYINEGQNLRWIYDLDHDDIFTTPIGGVCTVTGSTNSGAMPYTYRFTGVPGYTGHDCCAWHVDSVATGTIGTGQIIFYHNLDTSNPANIPPDTDHDGMRDLCDNCPLEANGPLLGSCLTGPKVGAPCRSNPECVTGLCSLSQEDDNGDKIGNACVPEPGMGALLASGLLGLVGLGNRKIARRSVYSSPSLRPAARIAASATSRNGSLASQSR